MAEESRAAMMRRLYNDERCNIDEIAASLKCHRSDVFWALQSRSKSAYRRRRFSAWALSVAVQPGPLRPSIGLQVPA